MRSVSAVPSTNQQQVLTHDRRTTDALAKAECQGSDLMALVWGNGNIMLDFHKANSAE